MEFSPVDKKLLVSEMYGKIYVFSNKGIQIAEMNLNDSLEHSEITSLEWWSNVKKYQNKKVADFNNNELNVFSQEQNENDIAYRKHLLIAFKNGTMILLDDETDTNPFIIKTEFKTIINAQWQINGLCFVVLGEIKDNKTNSNKGVAIFYNTEGEILLRVVCPTSIVSFSWGFAPTIAFEAQKCIYIGFIKYTYKWTYFCNTIVLAIISGEKKFNMIYLDTENKCKVK